MLEKIINPTQKEYRSYYESLKKREIEYNNEEGFVAVVGSDARRENGGKSKLELILSENSEEKYYIKRPSRMIDARFISGEESKFKKAKEEFFNTIKANYKDAKKSLKERGREYKRIMLKGSNNFKGEQKLHYSLDEGIAYYNEENGQLSFKLGPLRYIQNRLNLEILSKMDSLEFLLNLPANTEERAEFLKENEEIIDSYQYFIFLYHQTQFNKEIGFEKKEVLERLEGILKII